MFLHSLISEGCESSSSTIIMMPLSLTLPVKWNIKQKLFICITFNKLGEVSQLLPRLKDTAAAALVALLEALQPLHVDAQVQAEGQAALHRRLLPFGGTAAAIPTVAMRQGNATARIPSACHPPLPATPL